MGLSASGEENAEHAALISQWRQHQRAQPAAREQLRERELARRDVRFVDQIAADAARQAVLVDFDARLLVHGQLHRQRLTAHAHADDRQRVIHRVVTADAAEVHRQAFLQTADRHLVDALQILPLADRAGDLIEQGQLRQLPCHLVFRA